MTQVNINDPIDLVNNVLDYFTNNLNTYVTEVNTEKNAKYGAAAQMTAVTSYGQRADESGRQQELVKFQLIRDDITIADKNNSNYLASQDVILGCFVSFYDDGTETSFQKGQRYEESVFRAMEGMSFKETADIRIRARRTAPFTVNKRAEKTPQGLISAGIVISMKIGG